MSANRKKHHCDNIDTDCNSSVSESDEEVPSALLRLPPPPRPSPMAKKPPPPSSPPPTTQKQPIFSSPGTSDTTVQREPNASPRIRGIRRRCLISVLPRRSQSIDTAIQPVPRPLPLSSLSTPSNLTSQVQFYLNWCIPFILSNSSGRVNGDPAQNKSNDRLVKAYSKFIQLMWAKSLKGRQHHVMKPSSIAAEIRSKNRSFHSYTRQDAQEFLRCFIDELHSEMRIVQSSSDDKHRSGSSSTENSEMPIILPNRIVESEYETCNSDLTSSTGDTSNDDEKSEYSKRKISQQKSK